MAHAPITKRKKSHDHDLTKFLGKESILTSQINIYVDEAKPKIPDGGWGWMVVFAAFVLNTISEGVSFSFGLLYIEFLNEFQASKSATSWVGSLFLALPLIAGPLGSALVDRYGCIRMTILGSLICTTGFILSVYANSVEMLYLTFGLIGGVGRGLTFVTAVVSIAFWFEKKRTIALGLAASGAGFGTVVFAPLTTLLLKEFGWRGTLMVLAGCFFQMCVSGAVMRDPKWIIEEEREKKAMKSNNSNGKTITNGAKNEGGTQLLLERVNTSPDLTEKSRIRSAIDLPTFLKENEKIPFEVLRQLSENKNVYKIILENYPHLLRSKSTSDQDINNHSNENNHSNKAPLKLSMKVKKTEDVIPEEDEVKWTTVSTITGFT
ncbi:hypothetical protein JTB14_031940 [Gonioctena quinquepunctata]|nr:hypothetical protein JTB14_031940 [Gonioctena quinquepunctata]